MKEHKHNIEKDGDIDINLSRFKKIFSNNKRNTIILTTILLLIPIFLTIFIRLQPQYLPATDSWAENSVNNYYRNMVAQQIDAQYPNLPTTQKTDLVNQKFEEFKTQNQEQIQQQITQTSQYFKQGFQYQENGNTYTFLGDLDSYAFLRQARNIQEKGMICDEVKDEICKDNHMIAPLGINTGASMHPYGIFYLYNIMHFFKNSVNMMQAQFYLPTILAIIAVIATFFIGRRLMNEIAGFFAAMFLALSPMLLSRTLGSDTDIWNIMFPLVILWIFIEAFYVKKTWQRITLVSISGLLLGAFSFAWGGWWYIFDFIVVALIIYIVFEILRSYIKQRNITKEIIHETKEIGILFGVFIISTMLFVSIISSFAIAKSAFTSPLETLGSLKIAAHADLWPNVYTTVAELNEANLSTIVGQTAFGFKVFFGLALLGIIFLLVRKEPTFKEYLLIGFSILMTIFLVSNTALALSIKLYLAILAIPIIIATIMLLREKELSVDLKMAFLLIIWFVGMMFASTKGVRFILLLIPAFSIAIGIAIGYIYQYFSRVFEEQFHMKKILSKSLVFLLLCLLLIAPIQIGIATGKGFVPSLTKGWWDSLSKIREESKPDAIINSWWDFGHWFKYVADRAVTLDGASQNHPNAHWLGKILQSDNEKESIAILRMLDCGSNTYFEKINEKYNDTEISENIVRITILMNKKEAIAYLENLGFNNAEDVVQSSHCDPPENYFITSEDMVGKAGVWAHFGLWDFDRAYIINNIKPLSMAEGTQLMKQRFNYLNYTDDELAKIYYDVQALQTDREMNDWISPWPSYATGKPVPCVAKDDAIICPLGIGIGNNGQANLVLDRAVINVSDPQSSGVLLAFMSQTNQRLGTNVVNFKEIIIADQNGTFHTYEMKNASINLALLVNMQTTGNQTTYTAIVADPLLIKSTFTKLFFLDGKGTTQFEKFSDVVDVTGSRIIVWKVKW